MEPEFSLPHLQVSATCPYSTPAPSSPYPHIPLLHDPSYSKYIIIIIIIITISILGTYGIKWNGFNWLSKDHDGRICE